MRGVVELMDSRVVMVTEAEAPTKTVSAEHELVLPIHFIHLYALIVKCQPTHFSHKIYWRVVEIMPPRCLEY